MQFREKITRKEYEEIARRALRLFLSVDIVDSTALKQTFRQGGGLSWVEVAHGFYTNFPSALAEEFARIEGDSVTPSETSPGLWKALGDELIFVADVRRMEDIPAVLNAFRATINHWNRVSEEKGVTVKGAAWLAGFPVMNSAIMGDDAGRLDFLGLSIDIGFRLCHFASPRRFVFGVELAYVLAVLKSDLVKELQYLGKEALKGVLRDRPYPVFWLDCFVGDLMPRFAELALLEENVAEAFRKEPGAEQVEAFLRAWIDSTMGEICAPFCPTNPDPRFPVPADYEERIAIALADLEREFLESGEIKPDEGNEPDLNEFDDFFEQFNG